MTEYEVYDLASRSLINRMNIAPVMLTDAYVFANGPKIEHDATWLNFAKELSRQPRLDCKIQKYHRLDDGTFHPTFSQPVTVTIEFDMVLPSADPYSMFQAQLVGRPVAVCDLDAVAANDKFLASFDLGEFDVTFDYIVERGIGLFQKLEARHDWAQQHNVLPHLISSINNEFVRAELKVVDMKSGRTVNLETAAALSRSGWGTPLSGKIAAEL